MRSARSRFDDQEYFARTQPSDFSVVCGVVNLFMWFVFLLLVGTVGWGSVYVVWKFALIPAYKAVIG